MRIHLVINISQIIQYREQVGGQKVEEIKLVEVNEVEEQEIEKVLNKRKIKDIVKYLVQWKGFIAEHNTQEREENLENTKEVVVKFEKRMSVEVR